MTQLSGFYTIFFKRTDKYDNKYYAVPKSLFDKVEQVCEDLQLKNGCISPFQPEPDGKTFFTSRPRALCLKIVIGYIFPSSRTMPICRAGIFMPSLI